MARSKELCSIREWAPLTDIIELIPSRYQRGLFSTNLNITCVDAVPEFLALGSDAGIVFWYNRQTGNMQKLKAEIATRITCVKIVDSVEYMVAAGSSTGQISVFQIQKELPADLDLVAPCTRTKPIQRYTIRDLHRCVVSCCEWSKNGMKLYSGDQQGVVVLTEFDYLTLLSKSVEILSEAYEIVQLSVHQHYLLVASLYRTIICQRNANSSDWHITQVGKKDRKQLIDCGAVFFKQSSVPQLISGRPGLRFWLADAEGNVTKTILFKEAVLRSPTWEIPTLNPKHTSQMAASMHRSTSSDACVATNNFRELYLYDNQDALLVTHDDATLYILNLDRLRVEAVARGFRKILDFCICGKEIFVLEGERSLLRLAPLPEKPNKTARVIFNPMMPPPVPLLGATYSGSYESPVEPTLHNAEECFELPPIEKIDLNVPIELAVESPFVEQNRRMEIFRQIGETDFEQSILHNRGISMHKKSKSTNKRGGIVEIGQESHEREMSADTSLPLTNAATLMEASYCQMENNGLASPVDLKNAFIQHLPDALSPTTLQKTIAAQATALAVELDLPDVHLAPLTIEELNAPATSALKFTKSLSSCYPTALEEVGVQTTPKKQLYCPSGDLGDYSAGQPVDDAFAAATSNYTNTALKFVQTQTQSVTTDHASFLPDFRHASDPFAKNETPDNVDTNASSGWELLD